MIRRTALLAMMGALATVGAGCYVDAQETVRTEGQEGDDAPPPTPAGELAQPESGPPQPAPYAPPPEGAPQAAPPVAYEYGAAPAPVVVEYQPLYYGGYVVYYDNWGRPFYTLGGTSYYVPVSSPYYSVYVGHYRTYGAAYRGWYARGGWRTYGSRGYYGGFRGNRAGYRRGGRAVRRR